MGLEFSVEAAPPDTPLTASYPVVDLLIVQPHAGSEWLFGQTWIRIQTDKNSDIVYDMGSVDPTAASWLYLLGGQTTVRFRALSFAQLQATALQQHYSIYGRRLALPSEATDILITKLKYHLQQPSPEYPMDPVSNNRLLHCANILDEALHQAISRQASLPLAGTRRGWILAELQSHPLVRILADLLVRPLDDHPLSDWDAVFLPSGFKHIMDRASLNGLPIVQERYHLGSVPKTTPTDSSTPPFNNPNIPVWAFAIPIALLTRFFPRLGTLVGGGLMGMIGMMVLILQLGPSWHGIADSWYIVLFPPAHMALPLLAISATIWHRSRVFRATYISISFMATVTLCIASLADWVDPVSPTGMITGVIISLGMLLGIQRESSSPNGHRSPRVRGAHPRRAVSVVERNASYVRPRSTSRFR